MSLGILFLFRIVHSLRMLVLFSVMSVLMLLARDVCVCVDEGTQVLSLDMTQMEWCNGIMGIPITFMNQYNPSQFEILGQVENENLYGLKTRVYTTAECKVRYQELFGRSGTYDLNASSVIAGKKTYKRLLVRRTSSSIVQG